MLMGPGCAGLSAACILDVQDSISIRCRARFNAARFIRRIIAAKEISATCWMEASTLSMHIDRHVSAVFILGFIPWKSKPICKHTTPALAVIEAEYLDISRKSLHLVQAKAVPFLKDEGKVMGLMHS